jgi:cytochrome P450
VATFSSARGISFEEPTDEDMAARRTIIDTDPPDHTKLRKIVSGSFTQRAVAVYQHFVEGLTEQVLDARLADGELEFVDAVAKEVPIRVLARIMGLPEADLDRFIDLGDRLIANTDPARTFKKGSGMKAIVITTYGGPEVLAVAELPDPVPAAGEVASEPSAGKELWTTARRP